MLEPGIHDQTVPAFGVGNQADDAGPLAFGKEVEDADAGYLVGFQPAHLLPGPVDIHAPLVEPSHTNEVGAGVHQGGKLLAFLLNLPAFGDVPKVHGQTLWRGVGGDLVPAIKIGVVSRLGLADPTGSDSAVKALELTADCAGVLVPKALAN